MSTKKKPQPFQYQPIASVKMQEQAKAKQEFKNLIDKHNERLNYEASMGIHINVVNTVGDRVVMPVDEFRRKYLVTIDPRPDATNVFVAMDALTGSVYRRNNGNPEELVEYVEVNINAKEPVFTTDLEKTLAKAATDFANGDESALNRLEENAEQLVKEAVAEEAKQPRGRGVIPGLQPLDEFGNPIGPMVPLESADNADKSTTTEALDTMLDMAGKMADARNEANAAFTGAQGTHDVGLEGTPSVSDAPADDESFSLPG
jgi:hypothetical protein